MASFSAKAQSGTITLKDGDRIPCFVVGIDKDNVFFTIEGEQQKQSVKIVDIDNIDFTEGTYTFDENNKLTVEPRSFYLPKSKYRVENVGTGTYTLHGKPYKGPVLITYLDYAYAGKEYPYGLSGILVKVK